MPRRSAPSRSVARQLLLWQLAVVTLLVTFGTGLTIVDERGLSDDATRGKVTAIAESLSTPATAEAIDSPDPSSILQPITERIRMRTGVDFIVVMAPDRTRFTHTTPDLIGKPFNGNIDRALAGETFTETYEGSLGPSIRAVAPVYDGERIVGLVSAGVTREKISDQFLAGLPTIVSVAAAALLLAVVASVLIGRRLRSQTMGLAPSELRSMFEHHDAVLHSIGEGLIVWPDDENAPADLVNDEARRLLDLGDGPVRRTSLPESLRANTIGQIVDEMHVTGSRVLVVNQGPVMWRSRRLGTVMTLRDRTELQQVTGELDSVRSFAESLRAQAHESANRLHTVITMVELGRTDDALRFATRELELSQHLVDRLTGSVQEPALAALLLGKVSEAADHGVELTVTEDTALDDRAVLESRELVSLVGNLVDNAIDAARYTDQPWVEVTVSDTGDELLVQVADGGPGMPADAFTKARTRGYSTKSGHHGIGLALVAAIVDRHGGRLEAENTYGSVVTARIPQNVRSGT